MWYNKSRGADMDGIIVVNKEKNMTSHDVVAQIRKIFGTKKVGHLGTLDPLATGVLVVTLNAATKLAQFIDNVDKTYLTTICLGKATTTYDLEGEVTAISPVFPSDITEAMVDYAIKQFIGEIEQIPPIYSAIKVGGKKLYEYAREGKSVSVEPRKIQIWEAKRVTPLVYDNGCCSFQVRLTVSKGTYIRSFCYDLAKYLGTIGVMSDLVRLRSGSYTIEDASSLEQIKAGKYCLYNMVDAIENFPKIMEEEAIQKARHGMKISKGYVQKMCSNFPEMMAICQENRLIAIYQLDENCYKAVRVWN
ncbi:MAG: tRNA pseudouridine(55) synthase TruB [Prevotella sp.]|nr:tRNA pseudouridine(55) synthase TruB [Staphylococcus sp.]MCM1349723.1 tRNA pseudouridine(55) synthase TruB [Prevotella sp.]